MIIILDEKVGLFYGLNKVSKLASKLDCLSIIKIDFIILITYPK